MSHPDLAAATTRWFTDNDRSRSATVTHVPDLVRALEPLRQLKLPRMLDVGCGFGGLGGFVSEHLGIPEVHGIDIDPGVMAEARSKGIKAQLVELGKQPLPFPERHFDFIMSLGMMDYLPTYDAAIIELHRVLRPGGYVLVALPNLASWHNRLMLLMGYQPRDVEISEHRLTGLMSWYRDRPTGHIHTATLGAFEELMAYHGFTRVRVTGGSPGGRRKGRLVRALDAMLSRKVTLARRFFYLGTRVAVPQAAEPERVGAGVAARQGIC